MRDLGPGAAGIRQGRDIVARMQAGDPQVTRLVLDAGRRMGAMLATAMSVLNPDLVVVGGSVAQDNPELLDVLRPAALTRVQPVTAISARIVTSSIKNEAGLVGAAHLVLELVTEPAAVDAAIEAGVVLRKG